MNHHKKKESKVIFIFLFVTILVFSYIVYYTKKILKELEEEKE